MTDDKPFDASDYERPVAARAVDSYKWRLGLIATILKAYEESDEPEGGPSLSRTFRAIREIVVAPGP